MRGNSELGVGGSDVNKSTPVDLERKLSLLCFEISKEVVDEMVILRILSVDAVNKLSND